MVVFVLLISVCPIRDIFECNIKLIGVKGAAAASGYYNTIVVDGESCKFNLLVVLFLRTISSHL